MRLIPKVLLIGVTVVAGIATLLGYLKEREDAEDTHEPPCGLPPGFHRGHAKVLWNPISSGDRCPPASSQLIVDNGLGVAVRVAVGTEQVDVAAGQHLTIVTLPGAFHLHATAPDGKVIDDADLTLGAKPLVYNPGAAWDYVVETGEYEQEIFRSAFGGGGGEEHLPTAVMFEQPAVDYVLDDLPKSITAAYGTTVKKTALVHRGGGTGRLETRGALRVVEVDPGHLVLVPPLGAEPLESASIYLDNPDAKLAMTLQLDGQAIASVPRASTLRIDLSPGPHDLVATTGDEVDRATLQTAERERWVWTPTGRREYQFEHLVYGGATLTFGGPDPVYGHASAMPPFKPDVDFIFDAPRTIAGSEFGPSETKIALRLGTTGDFHKKNAKEIQRLGGKADPATASGCDVMAARLAAGKKRDDFGDPDRWGCPPPQ
jgi:hypothetical protein